MERYNEYKDSGVQWLGEIPSHWEVGKVKYYYKMTTGFTPPTGKADYYSDSEDNLWITIGDLKGKVILESNGHISDKYIRNFKPQIVPKGSLLYSFKLSVGQVAFAGKDLYTNEAIASFVNTDLVNLGYLFYMAPVFIIKNANTNIYGAHILNQDLIKNAIVVFPPLSEQQAISVYLDTATAKIDEAIAQQQKMIDLLNERKQIIINNAVTKGLNPNAPMKDSGVDWIGEIPEHWEVMKASLCVNISNGTDPKTEGDIPVYGSGADSFKTCGEYKEGPCVLIGRKGVTLHIPHYIEGHYWNVDTAFDVKAKDNILLKFYYLLATQFDYKYYMSQTTLPSMTSFDYNRMKLPIPSLAEQKDIVEFVARNTGIIDEAISNATKQIALLQERKQIIINDVVTGKVKVTN